MSKEQNPERPEHLETEDRIVVNTQNFITDPEERTRWVDTVFADKIKELAQLAATQDIPVLVAWNASGERPHPSPENSHVSVAVSADENSEGPLMALHQFFRSAARDEVKEATLALLKMLLMHYPAIAGSATVHLQAIRKEIEKQKLAQQDKLDDPELNA